MPRTRLKRVAAEGYVPLDERKRVRKEEGIVLLPPKPYRSWLEADFAAFLEEAGSEFHYEEDTLPYVVPAQIHTYTPDFKLPNGIIVETKGRWTSDDRKKMGLVIEQHPNKDIRMLFAIDNKLSPRSRTRYSDWCAKRSIKYAVGTTVPLEWLEEPGPDEENEDA